MVDTTDWGTATARGLLMLTLKPRPKPKLILPLMLGTDTMAADTGMAADMADTTVMANRFLNSNILPFF